MGLSIGKMNMDYSPSISPIDELPGSHSLPTWVVSLEHNSEDWSITSEYGQTTVKARDYRATTSSDNTTEAWYVQATRRLGSGWQSFLRYDVLYFDKEDKDGALFTSDPIIAFLGFPKHSRYAKDWVLGIRRDIGALSLSTEIHHVNGSAWISPEDNPNPRALVRDWNMLLMQAAWRF